MKIFKKIILASLSFVFAISLFACGNKETEFSIYDIFSKEIVNGEAEKSPSYFEHIKQPLDKDWGAPTQLSTSNDYLYFFTKADGTKIFYNFAENKEITFAGIDLANTNITQNYLLCSLPDKFLVYSGYSGEVLVEQSVTEDGNTFSLGAYDRESITFTSLGRPDKKYVYDGRTKSFIDSENINIELVPKKEEVTPAYKVFDVKFSRENPQKVYENGELKDVFSLSSYYKTYKDEAYLLNNKNVLIQRQKVISQAILDSNENADFSYVSSGEKILLKTYIYNIKTGKISEISCDYKISKLQNNIKMINKSKNLEYYNYNEKFANIAKVQKIDHKTKKLLQEDIYSCDNNMKLLNKIILPFKNKSDWDIHLVSPYMGMFHSVKQSENKENYTFLSGVVFKDGKIFREYDKYDYMGYIEGEYLTGGKKTIFGTKRSLLKFNEKADEIIFENGELLVDENDFYLFSKDEKYYHFSVSGLKIFDKSAFGKKFNDYYFFTTVSEDQAGNKKWTLHDYDFSPLLENDADTIEIYCEGSYSWFYVFKATDKNGDSTYTLYIN